jgi:hypothetical protein
MAYAATPGIVAGAGPQRVCPARYTLALGCAGSVDEGIASTAAGTERRIWGGGDDRSGSLAFGFSPNPLLDVPCDATEPADVRSGAVSGSLAADV